MAKIDKNPRQITRLRVEDALNLEKMSSVMYYDVFSMDTTETSERIVFDCYTDYEYPAYFNDEVYISGSLYTSEINFGNQGAMFYYNSEDDEFIFNDKLGNTAHLVLPAGESDIVTSQELKTLFGNQSIIGEGNIDLYKHYLELVAGGKTFRGVILSSNNLDCTGVGTKLITLLKCTPGESHYYEHFLDMSDTGSEYALFYNGSILQLTDGTSDPINITNVKDKVETL